MKLTVIMETPYALVDAINKAINQIPTESSIVTDKESVKMARFEQIKQTQELCKTWFTDEERIILEIDTELQTCTVMTTK